MSRILDLALDVLIAKREIARVDRCIKAIGKVQSDPASSAEISSLKTALAEKVYYSPREERDAIMLLLENEQGVSLWHSQVDAIRDLAPAELNYFLLELAMGQGKTTVISPIVISMIADGTTLPILIMPESLVESVALELQNSMHMNFEKECRLLPIDRVKHTAADIRHLREEMETMIEARVPLVWSAGDMQTLVNSYIEDMEQERGDTKKCEEWQRLFTLLRTKAEILADEVHAILDVLTSYNFAMGKREQLHQDEMVITSHTISILLRCSSEFELNDNLLILMHPYVSGCSPIVFCDSGRRHEHLGWEYHSKLARGRTWPAIPGPASHIDRVQAGADAQDHRRDSQEGRAHFRRRTAGPGNARAQQHCGEAPVSGHVLVRNDS